MKGDTLSVPLWGLRSAISGHSLRNAWGMQSCYHLQLSCHFLENQSLERERTRRRRTGPSLLLQLIPHPVLLNLQRLHSRNDFLRTVNCKIQHIWRTKAKSFTTHNNRQYATIVKLATKTLKNCYQTFLKFLCEFLWREFKIRLSQNYLIHFDWSIPAKRYINKRRNTLALTGIIQKTGLMILMLNYTIYIRRTFSFLFSKSFCL